MKSKPESGARFKRIVRIALVVLAALLTAMIWSGLSLKDLLWAIR